MNVYKEIIDGYKKWIEFMKKQISNSTPISESEVIRFNDKNDILWNKVVNNLSNGKSFIFVIFIFFCTCGIYLFICN